MDYPEDATPRRLETGCEARVFNDRGAFVARGHLHPRDERSAVVAASGVPRWAAS